MVNLLLKYLFIFCGIRSLFSSNGILITLLYFAIGALFSIATSVDVLAYKQTEKTRIMLEGLNYGQLRNNKQPEET